MLKRIVFTFGVGLFSLQAFCSTQNIYDINGLGWDTGYGPSVLLRYDPNPIPNLEIDYFPNNRGVVEPFNTKRSMGNLPFEINDLALLHHWNAFGPVLDPVLLSRVQGKLLITGGHDVKEHFLSQLLGSSVEKVVITGAHEINGYHIGLIRELVIEEGKTLTLTGTGLITDPESYSRVTFAPCWGERESNLMNVRTETRSEGVIKVWGYITD